MAFCWRRKAAADSVGDVPVALGEVSSLLSSGFLLESDRGKREKASEASASVAVIPNVPLSPLTERSIDDLYSVGKEIGRGGNGRVHEGFRISDGLPVALKFTFFGNSKEKEIPLLLKVRNVPGVIQMLDFRRWSTSEVIVLERPPFSTDLRKYVAARGRLNEKTARIIFKQIVKSISRCIELKVLHRDLKCENVLINEDTLQIKIIDFGCGCTMTDDPSFSYVHTVGTRIFNPPEWHQSNTFLADSGTVWTLGVMLYCMVTGRRPFQTVDEIRKVELDFPGFISRSCQKLILKCLDDAGKRIPLRKISKSKWMRKR